MLPIGMEHYSFSYKLLEALEIASRQNEKAYKKIDTDAVGSTLAIFKNRAYEYIILGAGGSLGLVLAGLADIIKDVGLFALKAFTGAFVSTPIVGDLLHLAVEYFGKKRATEDLANWGWGSAAKHLQQAIFSDLFVTLANPYNNFVLGAEKAKVQNYMIQDNMNFMSKALLGRKKTINDLNHEIDERNKTLADSGLNPDGTKKASPPSSSSG